MLEKIYFTIWFGKIIATMLLESQMSREAGKGLT